MRRNVPALSGTGGRRARRTGVTALASAALVLPLLGAAPGPAPAQADTGLQGAFAAAAREYRVPESVLLGVAYLQSRWDTHGGAPSVTGGYGPMHLTDARTALARSTGHHGEHGEDARGDESRPARTPEPVLPSAGEELPERLTTLRQAARLSGLPAERLRSDPAANIRGGAALLAEAQRERGAAPGGDAADWYGAVAAFSGAEDRVTATAYADEVFSVLRSGEARTTDSGVRVVLAPQPSAVADASQTAGLGLRESGAKGSVECPLTVSCEWLPAPYEEFGDGDYGNHDKADRPRSARIDSIVIHDTEATWDTTLELVQDPEYVSWHYSLRSTDGHIAQHLRTKDVGWHAGNWYTNAKSIGLEHEGFLADPDAWYTEAMYRTSARLVSHLARKYGIPLDRQHILGHDTVPGTTPATIPGMHTDPGPYWDWQHYFALLGAPLKASAGKNAELVTIAPEYRKNRPEFTGCEKAGEPCAPHGSSAVRVYTEPREDAPLVQDIGLRPDGSPSTIDVNDLGSRVSAGQSYAVAERRGEWTAIWYLGQKAWFKNPRKAPVAVPASGRVLTPRPGLTEVPVYGRAYPEKEAYPAGVTPQEIVPLPYRIAAGQRYATGGQVPGEYYSAPTFDTSGHTVVRGKLRYYEIQYGHRVGYVRADDVVVRTAKR